MQHRWTRTLHGDGPFLSPVRLASDKSFRN
jgi:hypothetical protein